MMVVKQKGPGTPGLWGYELLLRAYFNESIVIVLDAWSVMILQKHTPMANS
jgi:hypothetical protein